MNRKRRPIWMYFSVTDKPDKAKCDNCGELFSFKGGAVCNLRKHLSSKHPTILLENPVKQRAVNLGKF